MPKLCAVYYHWILLAALLDRFFTQHDLAYLDDLLPLRYGFAVLRCSPERTTNLAIDQDVA